MYAIDQAYRTDTCAGWQVKVIYSNARVYCSCTGEQGKVTTLMLRPTAQTLVREGMDSKYVNVLRPTARTIVRGAGDK